MPDINRVSLPENFYDITSPQLLAQPEPQYLYAQMYMAALEADLATQSDVGLPGRSIGGAGAEYSSAERDRLELSKQIMAGVFAGRVDFTGLPGSMIRFNRPAFLDTTYSLASRRIGVNQTISVDPINVGSEQVSLTLDRFAGPFDQVNQRPAPFGIDKFDASMGVHKLASMVGTHLRRDFHKFLDFNCALLLDQAAVVARPAGMTDDDSAVTAGSFPLDYETISRAERLADEANLPVFPDGNRLLVLTPTQLEQLKQDPDYTRSAKDWPQYNMLFPQYVSSIGKLHIFKSTTLNKPNNSSSVPVHRGHLIAPGALLGGMGAPPHVAASTADNYGERALVIWIAYLAMAMADNRFCISVRSAASA